MLIRQFIQSVLGLVFLVSSSFALSNTEFNYNVIDGGVEITGCVDWCPTDLVIPAEIDGYIVKSIGAGAFDAMDPNHNSLTSVIIPDSVTSIGDGAFSYNRLTSVIIPDGVTSIGVFVFAYNSLTSVIIPDGVTSIGAMAFDVNQLTSLTIPESVTSIGSRAFAYNRLTSVTGPDIWDIADNAFEGNETNYADQYWGDDAVFSVLDMDQNGTFDALTDALILMGYGFGLRHDRLLRGDMPHRVDISPISNRTDPNDIIAHIESQSALDIDQNGSFDGLTDALILLRFAFGLRGEFMISGAIAPNAIRDNAYEIEDYIISLMP